MLPSTTCLVNWLEQHYVTDSNTIHCYHVVLAEKDPTIDVNELLIERHTVLFRRFAEKFFIKKGFQLSKIFVPWEEACNQCSNQFICKLGGITDETYNKM